MPIFYFWLRGMRKRFGRLLVSRQDWWQEDRVWSTWVSLAVTLLRHSVHISAFKDDNSMKRSQRWIVFFEKGLAICAPSFTLCLFRSPGEAVSCTCLQWDARSPSLTAGHWPAALQLESNNPTGKHGQIGAGSCPETVEVRRQAFHSVTPHVSSAVGKSQNNDCMVQIGSVFKTAMTALWT